MSWIFAPDNITDLQGFVYIIRNNLNDKYYIGKKFFWSKRTRPPLKGRKNKRHYVIESDWRNYWGSSKNLIADIEKYGKENFTREILDLCKTKFDCAYNELLRQIESDVLIDPNSYNEIINVRLRKRK